MKFKKILSSVIAAAMAVTTFSAFSTTATAEDVSTTNYITINGATNSWAVNFQQVVEKQTIKEGTHTYELSFDLAYSDTLITSSSQYNGVQILLVDTTGAKFYEDIFIDVIVDGEEKLIGAVPTYNQYAWDSNSEATVAGYVYSITDADSESIGTINSNITFRVTATYEKSTTDVWNDNGDGTYTFIKGDVAGGGVDLTIPVANKADTLSVSMDVTVEGGANGTLGANIDETWEKVNGDVAAWENTSSFTWTFDGELTSDLAFQIWWANAGTKITVSNIQMLEANKVYTQKSAVENGVYSVRGVKLISEEDAKEADAVRFFFYNGTSTAAIDSTKCYHTIKAGGNTLIAPEGYVFVALVVGNIPEAKTVTCSNIQLAYND